MFIIEVSEVDEITVTQQLSDFVIEEKNIRNAILRKKKRTWYGIKTQKSRRLGSGSFNQIYEYSKDKVLRLSKKEKQETSENELSFVKGQENPEILVKVFAYGTVRVTADITELGAYKTDVDLELELEWAIVERGKGSLFDEFKRKQLSLKQINILKSHIDRFLDTCTGGHGDLKPENILVMKEGSFRIIDLPGKCPLKDYKHETIRKHIKGTVYTKNFSDVIIKQLFLRYLELQTDFTTDEDIQFVNDFFKYQDYFALIQIVLNINSKLDLLVNHKLRVITEFCVGFIDELYKRIFSKNREYAEKMAKKIFIDYCVGDYPRCSYNAFLDYFKKENKKNKRGGVRIKNKRTKKKYLL